MIECIFTIDYEIYGNGDGSLKELIYDPAERLAAIFRKHGKPFVAFVEAAELEIIEANSADTDIELVKNQVRELYEEGIEIGLHLHPQWYNAKLENGAWLLDFGEYNLCTLTDSRIQEIVDRAINYLKRLSGNPDFVPSSFRAGNWLFQPTQPAAGILASRGLKMDSSVFKGGMQKQHNLDYRRALKNGYYWPFLDSVDVHDPKGCMLEMPIFTKMVPFWKMVTAKRINLQQKSNQSRQAFTNKINNLRDKLRLMYPLKFDFCRMSLDELIRMVDEEIEQHKENPGHKKPLVAIGHTKDLIDLDTVESFLEYLESKRIRVSTLNDAYQRIYL